MPAYNFQARFAPLVEDGRKQQTIRADRKDGRVPQVDDYAHCYTGMRTAQCRKLGMWLTVRVSRIVIQREGILLDGAAIHCTDLDAFAQSDGFADWEGMLDWFDSQHGLPFAGDLVQWLWSPDGKAVPA